MTNREILMAECATRGISEEVHTFSKWKSMGRVVKKGEHALFETSLWKFKVRAKDVEETEDVQIEHGKMFLAKAFLFGKSQTEVLEDADNAGKDKRR